MSLSDRWAAWIVRQHTKLIAEEKKVVEPKCPCGQPVYNKYLGLCEEDSERWCAAKKSRRADKALDAAWERNRLRHEY